jgi:hypothetical protein
MMMFNRTNKASLKKAEILVRYMHLFSMCKDEYELVLATSEGWSPRKMLDVIMKNAGGILRKTMTGGMDWTYVPRMSYTWIGRTSLRSSKMKVRVIESHACAIQTIFARQMLKWSRMCGWTHDEAKFRTLFF